MQRVLSCCISLVALDDDACVVVRELDDIYIAVLRCEFLLSTEHARIRHILRIVAHLVVRWTRYLVTWPGLTSMSLLHIHRCLRARHLFNMERGEAFLDISQIEAAVALAMTCARLLGIPVEFSILLTEIMLEVAREDGLARKPRHRLHALLEEIATARENIVIFG